jgi:hypothetical protein
MSPFSKAIKPKMISMAPRAFITSIRDRYEGGCFEH